MPNTVQLKRSSTANSVPSAGNLVVGELAINYTDGNLFYKNASNVVTVIASNKFSSVTGNVDAGNIRTTGVVSATGNVTGNRFIGNVTASGSNTWIQFNTTGNVLGASSSLKWDGTNLRVETSEIALGSGAGSISQGFGGTAAGYQAGQNTQGTLAVAYGYLAGRTSQGTGAVAVGYTSGRSSQQPYAVAVGQFAGYLTQGADAIAIGDNAGYSTQGTGAIAIGAYAGNSAQAANSIVLNATGAVLDNTTANSFVVAPVRNVSSGNVMQYNASTKEISYDSTLSLAGNITGGNLLTGGSINSTGSGTQSLTVTSTATAAYVQTTGNNTVNARLQSNASTASVGTISNHLFIIQTNATNAVTIDTSQNVGIGVTPTAIQSGYKAIQIGATVGGGIVSAGTDTYFTNNFYVTGGTWYTGSTGYGSYYNQTAGAHTWSISTTAGAAGAKSLSTQMTLDAGGNLSVVGDVIGYASSDKKFKTNIRPIPNALSAVEYIGGKLFDWTDEYMESVGQEDGYFRQKEDFGIVAQDVQKVFPLAVRTRPDGSLAVDYVKLSALAFASIAELSAKLKDLEGKINDLTSRT